MTSANFANFRENFGRLNGLAPDEVKAFVVRPGMAFGAVLAWWRPGTMRPAPHAGIDFVSYRNGQGREQAVPAGAAIPALSAGEVGCVFKDFLGQTVLLWHPFVDSRGWRFCTIYGHLVVASGLAKGVRVAAGEQLGKVVGAAGARMAPHLHLSLGWLAAPLVDAELAWPTLERSPLVELLDPEPFLGQGQVVITGQAAAVAEGGG